MDRQSDRRSSVAGRFKMPQGWSLYQEANPTPRSFKFQTKLGQRSDRRPIAMYSHICQQAVSLRKGQMLRLHQPGE